MQAFSAWIHICAVRLFTESILRYGLPPQFLGVLMKPNNKAQAKLRKCLAAVFGSQGWQSHSPMVGCAVQCHPSIPEVELIEGKLNEKHLSLMYVMLYLCTQTKYVLYQFKYASAWLNGECATSFCFVAEVA